MKARRITYITLLAVTAALHLAYGQYTTLCMVVFMLCLPLISLAVSIRPARSVTARIRGGSDVRRGRKSSATFEVTRGAVMPPAAVKAVVVARNSFTGRSVRSRISINRLEESEIELTPDTSQLGTIRYTMKRAYVFDRLGIIPIPVKNGGEAELTVLPNFEKPYHDPQLIEKSTGILKPKPGGFAEEHEMRPYRDGDPLNLIHWKLSAKMNEYILREPQEMARKRIIIAADLPEDYEEHRSLLEQLAYLNWELMKYEVPYSIRYGRALFPIESVNDFDNFIKKALSEPMRCEPAPMSDDGPNTLICRLTPGRRADK